MLGVEANLGRKMLNDINVKRDILREIVIFRDRGN